MSLKLPNVQTTTRQVDFNSVMNTPCDSHTHRECIDGSCVLKNELCEEEAVLNQNTILIMIVIGLAVVIFIIILYCFQKRTGRPINRASLRIFEAGVNDGDNASLYNPPPTYNDVVTSGLYPPTPQPRRAIRMSSSEEPITPPPNYQAALTILAQSHESVLTNKNSKSSNVIRRSISVDSTSTTDPTSQTFHRLPSIGQ